METNIKLSIETVFGLMEPSYELVTVDHNENLNNNFHFIQHCIRKQCPDEINDKIDNWYEDAESSSMNEIFEKLIEKYVTGGFKREVVERFFRDNVNAIADRIYLLNDSDPLYDLLQNTSEIPVRIELHSNYDCINSHWFEGQGGYSYQRSYFGDMVDALNLNPAKVKKILLEHRVKVFGRFPNKQQRETKELVSYEDFYEEMINSSCPANLLTFIATVKPLDLYDCYFEIKKITIPKGNRCGIFSSSNGGGSILEMKLQSDVTLELDAAPYDFYSLTVDCNDKYGYGIGQVYGVYPDFFGKPITINN